MNRPEEERSDELTDRLAGVYRAQRESPPPMLDALILAKARRAAEQRRLQRIRRLGGSFAVAAVLVLGLALSLQVLVTPTEEYDRNGNPVGDSVQPVEPVPLDPLLQRKRESAVVTPAPSVVSEPLTAEAAPASAAPAALRAIARPQAVAPAPTQATADLLQLDAPAVVAPAAPAPRSDDVAAELERLEVTGARAKRTQLEGAMPVTRDAGSWLAEIDRLIAEGKTEDAARELVGFCRAYADHARCAKK